MEFRILGPLEVIDGDRLVALGGGKVRALLAVLLLHVNEVVPSERLIDELWGEAAPATVAKSVQVYVSHLRRALRGGPAEDGADGLLVTRAGGYMLRLEPGQFDLDCFERLLQDGRRALRAGEPERAAGTLREALALWRGPPLVDFGYEPFAQQEIARLEELRMAALEERIEADLALGRHAELVAELETLVAAQPLRERIRGQLMLALYRCGRQAEALDVYRQGRERLVEELGLEPGTELAELQAAILRHDPALNRPRERRAETAQGSHRARLPAPPNRTIGRQHDIAAIVEQLTAGETRLLTLTGPGGVGKTRLALEVAREVEATFEDGARWVSLAPVRTHQDVATAVTETLGIALPAGETAEQAVERFLSGKRLLLVLDNCEHVLMAAPFVGNIVARCPGVLVLATSREPLALQAEARHPVLPLGLADAGSGADSAALATVDSVALFTERARIHDPAFRPTDANASALAEICRRLDGLPLAIELAAARCALLSVGEIARRLDAALREPATAARDAPARHRTLSATIDWSYQLLDEDERHCFCRFAVFAGGATVSSAEAVTGGALATIERLVAKSLLVRRRLPGGETRLTMLETIRAYAVEHLSASGEREVTEGLHFQHFLEYAERHGNQRALGGLGSNEHLLALDAEADNLRAALVWATARTEASSALAITEALGEYWLDRARYREAIRWIEPALDLPGAEAHPVSRVRVLCVQAICQWPLGHSEARGDDIAIKAERIARSIRDPLLICEVLELRAERQVASGRLDAAEALAQEALHWATTAGDGWRVASTSRAYAQAAANSADLRERVAHAAAQLETAGNFKQLARMLAGAAYAAIGMHADDDAAQFIERALPIARAIGSDYLSMHVQGNLGMARLFAGDTRAAAEAFRAELELCRETFVVPAAFEGLLGLAAVAAAQGDNDRAARLSAAADAHRYGRSPDPVDKRIERTYIEPARRQSRTGAWRTVADEGAIMSLEAAIDYAIAA